MLFIKRLRRKQRLNIGKESYKKGFLLGLGKKLCRVISETVQHILPRSAKNVTEKARKKSKDKLKTARSGNVSNLAG